MDITDVLWSSGSSLDKPRGSGCERTILLPGGGSLAGPLRERSARGHLRAARTKTRGRGPAASILMRSWGSGCGLGMVLFPWVVS